MAKFIFTAPDNTKIEITAPKGATREQAHRKAMAHWQVQNDPITKGAKNVVKEVGPLDAIAIGAGRTFDKAAKGLEQKFYQLTGNNKELQRMDVDETGNTDAMKSLQAERPSTTTAGEILPYMAVPGMQSAGTAAMIGGGLEGLRYTPEGESAGWNAVKGAATAAGGYEVGKYISKAISPGLKGNLSSGQDATMRSAKKLGAKVTPGQRLGSHTLQKVEASMDSFPPTTGVTGKISSANQKILNKSATKAIGESGDDVSGEVLDRAFHRLGQEFEAIKNIPVVTTRNTRTTLLAIKQSSPIPELLESNPFFKEAEKFSRKGVASGKEIQSLISRIGKRASSEMRSQGGNRDLGQALFVLKESLDDAIDVALPPAKRAARKTAREQYRNLMNILPTVNEQTGNVSGKLLANKLSRTDKSGMRLGKNTTDLYDMARFAKAFPGIVGDSGTATRYFLPWLASSSGVGALGGAAAGQPVLGALAGLGLPLAAKGLSEGYIRSAPYLTNQLLSPALQRAIAASTAKASLGLLKDK